MEREIVLAKGRVCLDRFVESTPKSLRFMLAAHIVVSIVFLLAKLDFLGLRYGQDICLSKSACQVIFTCKVHRGKTTHLAQEIMTTQLAYRS